MAGSSTSITAAKRSSGCRARRCSARRTQSYFPANASTLNTNDERIWLTGQAEELVEHLAVKGESRTFASHKFPLRDRAGEIVAIAGISVDITARERTEGVLRRERELTQRIVDSVADGILAFDLECRYTLWNPEMERISGIPASAVLGKSAFEAFPFLVATGENKCFYEALAGRKCKSKEQRFDVPESGRSGLFEGDYSPLHDANDNVIGGIAIIRDITQKRIEEEKRLAVVRAEAARAAAEAAAQRFAFLAEAGELLSSSLDYEHTLGTLASLAIPVLADVCIVDVVEDRVLRRVGLASVREDKRALMEELRGRFPPTVSSPQPAGRVLREGKPELLKAVDMDIMQAHCVNADHVDLIQRIGMRSHLAVPILVRGTIVGIISLAITESERRYDESDLALATDLARRAALAVDNALLYRAAHTELAERRRVDEELRLSEQRFRAVFEQSPLSMQIFSRDGTTMRVNAAWKRSSGRSSRCSKATISSRIPSSRRSGSRPSCAAPRMARR